jgi:hypothetical protein
MRTVIESKRSEIGIAFGFNEFRLVFDSTPSAIQTFMGHTENPGCRWTEKYYLNWQKRNLSLSAR